MGDASPTAVPGLPYQGVPLRLVVRATVVLALAAGGVVAPTVSFDAAQAAPHPVSPHVHRLALHGVDRAAARHRDAFAAAASGDVDGATANRLDPESAVPLPPDAPPATPQPADPAEVVVLDPPTATAHFIAAGVTWDPGQDVDVTEVAMRVRENGTWTAWQSLAQTGDGLPTERPGTEPLLSNGADGVQVRVTTADGEPAPAGLRVDLVDPGTSAADGRGESVPVATAQATTGDVLRPAILTRAQWGADESIASSWPDVSSKLSAMYLHHTAGSNTYTKAQAAAQVRAIYAFHVKSRGWPDIGYQFLVDRFGTIYQGRRDAVDDLPIGAQAGGYNTDTVGVSAMGNFQTAKPTTAMLTSIERVFAWLAYANKLDVRGRTTLTTGTSTGSGTRAKPGSRVTVPVILGHRDTNVTACPGQYLYAKLPGIRTVVAARVDAAVAQYGSPRPPLARPAAVAVSSAQYPVQWSSTVTYAWKKIAGAVKYQVLTTSAGVAESGPDLRSWTVYKTTTGTSASVTTSAGRSRVIAVRGVDSRGRRGPVTKIAQIQRPVPWSSITRSGTWKAVSAGGVTAYRASSSASLSVKAALVRGVYLRVRGTTAGKLTVTAGSATVGTIDVPAGTATGLRTVHITVPTATTGAVRIARSSGTVEIVDVGFARSLVGDPVLTAPAPPLAPRVVPLAASQAPVNLGTTVRLGWQAAAGATSYEVMARRAAPGGALTSTWTRVATAKGTTALVSMSPPGYTWYFGVRAVGSGGRSPIAVYALTTRPVSAAYLARSSGWSTVSVARAFGGKEYVTSSAGRTITVKQAAVGMRHLGLVVDAAPGRGRVAVYVNGTRVGTLSTAATTANVRRVAVLHLSSARSGTVVLRTLDAKPVRISAVVLAR
jgi:hypothetical protein